MSHELAELLRSVLKEELQRIHERLGRLEARQQRLEEQQQRLKEMLDRLLSATRSHFEQTEDKPVGHQRMSEGVPHDWRHVNMAIDYLKHKISQHDFEIDQLKKQLERQQPK
ncbi:hypothetical protein ACPVTF_12375 [Geobacillus icigianus]|uniref:Uncharacterized protein n=1 Tax=Geobacillus subterraneus TaxID=129338 RepID=A0A679FHP4_9BACL|nr:hypothetical protein [Geobacillus subterraneus]BBW95628.1 hypothetical protein GsuE55_04610 [Geobacillus subterraneus]